ncbi:MAG: response regulator transcription factor, partial [Pseudomonadota bacterium]
VEDDEETSHFIQRGLKEAGDIVETRANGKAGLLEATTKNFDAIIFDRLLPEMDGVSAVKLIREAKIDTPIIILTALGGIDDRVEGLEAGADDYLVKPFSFAELYARLRALSRRKPIADIEPVTSLSIADLRLERTTQKVMRGNIKLELMPREYKILEYLMLNEGQLVTRTMLLEKIWGYHFDPKTSLVQTHVSRLRNKVDKPFDHELIKTIRGSGYAISAD